MSVHNWDVLHSGSFSIYAHVYLKHYKCSAMLFCCIVFCCVIGNSLCCVSVPPKYLDAGNTLCSDLDVSTTQTKLQSQMNTQQNKYYDYTYKVCNIDTAYPICNMLMYDVSWNMKTFISTAYGANYVYDESAPPYYYRLQTSCNTKIDGVTTSGWWIELNLLTDVYISGVYLETHPYFDNRIPYILAVTDDGVNYNSIYSSTMMSTYYETISFAKRKHSRWRIIVNGVPTSGYRIDLSYFELKMDLCTPGQFHNSNCVCQTCPAGSYSDNGFSSTCLRCAAGTYSTQLGSSSESNCINCDVMKFSATPGSSTCVSCPIGLFTTNTGASSCDTCAIGSMFDGTSSCSLCPAGAYATVTGLSACLLCDAGTYSTQAGSAAAANCIRCAAGAYSTALGASSFAACAFCAPGTCMFLKNDV